MEIRVYVKDMASGKSLQELGTVVCDNIARALDMYNEDEAWCDKGYEAEIAYETIKGA